MGSIANILLFIKNVYIPEFSIDNGWFGGFRSVLTVAITVKASYVASIYG